ncbi:hypothetical protein [Candidatus Phycosocius bacilliformis]|nr:hypothetical protein [Candidatus Phycosocius bacilliformis]
MSMSSRRSAIALSAASAATLMLGPKMSAAAEEKKEEAGEPLVAELTNVVLPLARDGALVNYLFVTLKIRMSDLNAAAFVREQHFLVRDGITRASSRSPIPIGKSPGTFDTAAVVRLVTSVVNGLKPGLRVVRVSLEQAAFMRR